MAMALGASSDAHPERIAPEIREYLDQTKWNVKVEGDTRELYTGTKPLITFPPLAQAAQGIGFLSLKPTGTELFAGCLCSSDAKAGFIQACRSASFAAIWVQGRKKLP